MAACVFVSRFRYYYSTFNSFGIAYLKRYNTYMYEICLSALMIPQTQKLFGYEFLRMVVGLMMAMEASISVAFSFIFHFSFFHRHIHTVCGVSRYERDLRLCIFLPFNFPVAFSEIYFNVFVSKSSRRHSFVWLNFFINRSLSFLRFFLFPRSVENPTCEEDFEGDSSLLFKASN